MLMCIKWLNLKVHFLKIWYCYYMEEVVRLLTRRLMIFLGVYYFYEIIKKVFDIFNLDNVLRVVW